MKEAFIKAHVTFDQSGVMTVHSEVGSMPFMGNSGPLEANSQTALIWMLKLDYFDSDNARRQAVNLLIDNVKNEDPDPSSVRAQYGVNTLSTGFLGTNVLTPILTEIGAGDVAYDVILNEDMPSWLQAVNNGATTMWERWDSYSEENGFGNQSMNSYNHFANGSIAEWMYRYMAGIATDPSAPGFKNVILQPTLDTGIQYNNQERINEVKSAYDSYYGRIVSNWKSKASALTRYETVIPANTTADLYLPVSEAQMNGFVDIEGVAYQGMVQHNGQQTAHFKLQAGGYIFEVTDGELNVKYADAFTDAGAAQAVVDQIAALGEITSLDQAEAVQTARAAYNALTDAQKKLVTNEDILVAAEKAIEALQVKRGDINRDGKITVSDVVALRQLIVVGTHDAVGDMDQDGKLTVSDVVGLRAAIVAGA